MVRLLDERNVCKLVANFGRQAYNMVIKKRTVVHRRHVQDKALRANLFPIPMETNV